MKNFVAVYSKIIGLIALVIVLSLLFSEPSMILAKSVNTIGTELSYATADETRVRTIMDFGDNEHIQAFPTQIGTWSSVEYDAAQVAQQLGADVLLMRAYWQPKYSQPVFFLIMQSNNRSSFHPPIVCYPALGFAIEEEGKVALPVPNASWAEGPWLSEWDVTFNGTIAAKKLVVVREAPDGSISERRVVLYFYVKDRLLGSDTVTMVRVSALAPLEGSYEQSLTTTMAFAGETIPYMFELQRDEPLLIETLISGSALQQAALVMILLMPLTIFCYPQLRTFYQRRCNGNHRSRGA